MNTNRALEFLEAAQASFPILHDRWGWQAKHFVALAITEVQELVDRLALYEATDYELEQRQRARPTATPDAGPVLIVDAQAMTPALLAARPRAALPGNGKGL